MRYIIVIIILLLLTSCWIFDQGCEFKNDIEIQDIIPKKVVYKIIGNNQIVSGSLPGVTFIDEDCPYYYEETLADPSGKVVWLKAYKDEIIISTGTATATSSNCLIDNSASFPLFLDDFDPHCVYNEDTQQLSRIVRVVNNTTLELLDDIFIFAEQSYIIYRYWTLELTIYTELEYGTDTFIEYVATGSFSGIKVDAELESVRVYPEIFY